jgi:SAM-dependent methyltransferase
MAMADFERRFDLIECVGVLHHLADPERGWRILTGLLRPGGVMKIGLYSEAARRDVVAGRALIAAHGYAPSPSGIRRCRQDIAARAHDGDPAMARLTQRDSFFSASEGRDFLGHGQAPRVTLPRIEAALAALKLEFLGFEFPGPPPRAPASLADWHRFEAAHPDTFTGMYEFWVRKP